MKTSQARPREDETSPREQDRKRHEGGSQSIIEAMKDLLTKDQEKRDNQHTELVNAFGDLRSTVDTLKTSIDNERTTRENDIDEIKVRLGKIENGEKMNVEEGVKNAIAKTLSSQSKNAISTSAIDVEDRENQVIVSGFDMDSDQDIIIAKIEEILAIDTRRAKVVNVDTFTDPSSFGVITFTSPAAKIGFFKNMKSTKIKLDNGKEMTFKNNETFPARIRNKIFGQIKFQLNRKLGHELKDIHIDRKKWIVKLKTKIVATINDDNETEYDIIAQSIKPEVDNFMKDWIMKRSRSED